MNVIEIKHNPFTVETVFLIDGQEPDESCKLSSYREARLQIWVERLFDDLRELFNGERRFSVLFRGVESDYLDLEEAAETARGKGVEIQLSWSEAAPVAPRFEAFRRFWEDAKRHPKLRGRLEEDQTAQRRLDRALDQDFDVYVAATMSSGKSTLINAMLGRDLLPARNEATTAVLARIVDSKDRNGAFFARRWGFPTPLAEKDPEKERLVRILEEAEDASLALIDAWNQAPETESIEIFGDVVGLKRREDVRLILTDTPGPNNSRDPEHAQKTLRLIGDTDRNPLILYILNAGQLGVKDDRSLLEAIGKAMRKGGKQSRDRFLFILNKTDLFDSEKGEHVSEVLGRVRGYLESLGIPHPQIYPVSAALARLIRLPSDQQTQNERRSRRSLQEQFCEDPTMNMPLYAPASSRVRRTLQAGAYPEAMLESGLPTVEATIDEYVEKHHLPHRLKRAHDVVASLIEKGLDDAELVASLNRSAEELALISQDLEALKKRREEGFNAQGYRESLEHGAQDLDPETLDRLDEAEADIQAAVREARRGFNGVVKTSEALGLFEQVQNDLRARFDAAVVLYEEIFAKSQNHIKQTLAEGYRKYVQSLFETEGGLLAPNFGVLEGLRKSVAGFDLRLDLAAEDVHAARVKIGERKVSRRRLWPPSRWFLSSLTQPIYEKEERVDLERYWQQHGTSIVSALEEVSENGRMRIREGRQTQIAHMVEFMEAEFQPRFEELLDAISAKITDQNQLKAEIEAAKKTKEEISLIKLRFKEIISI